MAVAPVPFYETLAAYRAEFSLVDLAGVPFSARWEWEPSRPARRTTGISGWARVNGERIRVHVCAQSPCTAMFAASKYGALPVPRHGRLIPPAVAGAVSSEALVGGVDAVDEAPGVAAPVVSKAVCRCFVGGGGLSAAPAPGSAALFGDGDVSAAVAAASEFADSSGGSAGPVLGVGDVSAAVAAASETALPHQRTNRRHSRPSQFLRPHGQRCS